MNRMGSGKVKLSKNSFVYIGTLPNCENEDEIVILRKEDLELIIKSDISSLLSIPYTMSKNFYEKNKEEDEIIGNPIFVDEITYIALDKTRHKLFLDRHFYSNNLKDEMWIRYVSVDKSLIEEGPDGGLSNDD